MALNTNHSRSASAKRTVAAAPGRLTVKDIMTRDPISVEPSLPARELAAVLADNNISGAPVVDVQDRVIGVVSRTDLLQWCVMGGFGLGSGDLLRNLAVGRESRRAETQDLGTVEDFMTSDPILTTADQPVDLIARRMAEERVHRIIVVDDDGCLEGIVTSLDLLKVFPKQS
jgi:CBS domain-containing protein